MTTVIQFYNLLKGDSNDRFEAMWEKIVGSDFYYFYIFIANNEISKFQRN